MKKMRLDKTVYILLVPVFFLVAFTITRPISKGLSQKTPVPPRDLDPKGPWVVALSAQSLLIANSDGSGLDQPFKDTNVRDVSLSPDSNTIAVMIDDTPKDDSNGLALALYKLPFGPEEMITPLQNPALTPKDETDFTSPESERGVGMSTPAWSHDGKSIAFIGQINGPTADLYLYNTETKKIEQLSKEESQAYHPSWSPDDRYIFFAGAVGFGTGAGYWNAGSWFISRDGKQIIETTTEDKSSDEILVWVDPHQVILGSWGPVCGTMDIRKFDVDSGETVTIWPDYIKEFSFSPATGQLALLIPPDHKICTMETQRTGLYLVDSMTGELQRISDGAFESLRFDPSTGHDFILRSEDKLYRLKSSGEIVFLAKTRHSDPEYSAVAKRWLWYRRPELFEGVWAGTFGGNIKQVYEHPIGETILTPGGKSIYFLEMGIGRLYRAVAPEFESVPIITSDKLYDWTLVIYAEPGVIP